MNEVSFVVGGRSYPFVSPSEMTMGEAREMKRLSGGMGLVAAEAALRDVDPDAWTATLLISMRRVDPAVRDAALDDVSPVELVSALGDAIKARDAAADAVPPPLAVDAPADSSGETTPGASGA